MMRHHRTPPAPLTLRDAPDYLGACEMCGNTPALPGPSGFKCAACTAREALQDAAAEQLRELLAPLLGAWAAHWNAAGLTPEALAGIVHLESDRVDRPHRSRRSPFLTALRALLRFRRPLPYVDSGPGRYTIHPMQLPTLAEVRPPEPGEHARYYTRQPDGTRRELASVPGLDLLTLELPDGSAALIPLGYRGTLELDRNRNVSHAVRIPAHLREQARGLYYASHEPMPAEPLERGEVLT